MTDLHLQGHPRANEIMTLAREHSEESQEKLKDLLEELGLPRDAFLPATPGSISKKDRVLIGDRVCEYEISDHVMEVRGGVDDCQRLIDHANRLGSWKPSTQVSSDGLTYQSTNRTSWAISITEGSFTGLYTKLVAAVTECARFYRCWNEFLSFRASGDWEILRYEPGEKFGVHADVVVNTKWGDRQLSALIYLNDDFEGGETRFVPPGPALTVKPEAGKVALFPPHYTHPHESLPVTRGTKYVALGWFYP